MQTEIMTSPGQILETTESTYQYGCSVKKNCMVIHWRCRQNCVQKSNRSEQNVFSSLILNLNKPQWKNMSTFIVSNLIENSILIMCKFRIQDSVKNKEIVHVNI